MVGFIRGEIDVHLSENTRYLDRYRLGAAVMQPSFPATLTQKIAWLSETRSAIKDACKGADAIVISHYHHDHYMRFDESIYEDKSILAKDPNRYINDSQMLRAESFYRRLTEALGDIDLEDLKLEKVKIDYPDPMESLPLARSKDYGDYNERKRELLEKVSEES